MKAILICPAFRPAVPHLAETGPLATLPILGENLVNFWLEHVAALGARHVIIVAADRPELVHAIVGDGRRWGVAIEFVATHAEPTVAEAAARHRPKGDTGWLPAPHEIVVMNHLPGCGDLPLFDSYGDWFAALQTWMPRALTPARVRFHELRPGIWVGSGARIAPSAKLHAPCWIGDHVTIEADTVVGPGAILEEHAVIGAGANVTESVIGPNTFVGRLTAVRQSLAAGNRLINWRTESVLRVPDSFLLCSLVNLPSFSPDRPGTGGTPSAAAGQRGWFRPLRWLLALFGRSRPEDAKLSG